MVDKFEDYASAKIEIDEHSKIRATVSEVIDKFEDYASVEMAV
ncbi:hypothetical protein [Candidatus Epulonipiscium viviparus]|nr:hypothetical protein [Candidatus Epulopiscium viviparus]